MSAAKMIIDYDEETRRDDRGAEQREGSVHGGDSGRQCSRGRREVHGRLLYPELTWDGAPLAQVDIFRLEDGMIVEHWDNFEPVPENDVNGGKF